MTSHDPVIIEPLIGFDREKHEIRFFKKDGTMISEKEVREATINEEQFFGTFLKRKLLNYKNPSVFIFGPASECKFIYKYGDTIICFWYECETGRYLRPCEADEI